MNDKCNYCIYRDKSWRKEENAYGCEAASIGLCGEPGMEQRHDRRIDNRCLLCEHRRYGEMSNYGCDDPDCCSACLCEFKPRLPEGSMVIFRPEGADKALIGTIEEVTDIDVDPHYVIDVDGERWYVLWSHQEMRRYIPGNI